MRAMVFDRCGGPDVLCLRNVPVPEPQDGEVLIRSAMRVSIQPTRNLANPDQNGPGNLERLLERWPDLIGCFDHDPAAPKASGESSMARWDF